MMVNLPCLMVSCTNFLRPTCSYTECQLSFQTGACPTERTTASYSSCLYLIFTDLLLPSRKLIFSGRSPLFQLLAFLLMQRSLHSIIVYGFLIQNPARFQNSLKPSKALEYLLLSSFMLLVLTSGLVLLCPLTSSSDRMLSLLSG